MSARPLFFYSYICMHPTFVFSFLVESMVEFWGLYRCLPQLLVAKSRGEQVLAFSCEGLDHGSSGNGRSFPAWFVFLGGFRRSEQEVLETGRLRAPIPELYPLALYEL